MPSTASPQGRPSHPRNLSHPSHPSPSAPMVLTAQEREVLYALGCGLGDAEIADALGLAEHVVAGQLRRVLVKLGLRDRAAAIVYAFDCGLVLPGQGPRRQAAMPGAGIRQRTGPASGPWLRVSVLGPLRAWLAGQPVDVGPLRQQAVLAALALSPDRSVSRRELLDGVWGMESPGGNVVPVYVYRLRKSLRLGESPDSVIRSDRYGYGLVRGVAEVDVACVEELVSEAGAAERAGDLSEAVRLCARALELFRGEPLAGLPGPLAELERLRLTERRVALAQRKAEWLLRLGQDAEAIAELSALALDEPLNEPVAALLMHALQRGGRRAEALAIFDRTTRRLREDLGVAPGELLVRARGSVLRGGAAGRGAAELGRGGAGAGGGGAGAGRGGAGAGRGGVGPGRSWVGPGREGVAYGREGVASGREGLAHRGGGSASGRGSSAHGWGSSVSGRGGSASGREGAALSRDSAVSGGASTVPRGNDSTPGATGTIHSRNSSHHSRDSTATSRDSTASSRTGTSHRGNGSTTGRDSAIHSRDSSAPGRTSAPHRGDGSTPDPTGTPPSRDSAAHPRKQAGAA